jgi:hypothetical protein
MFVKESIEQFLKPKTGAEVKTAFLSLDREGKEELIMDRGLEIHLGSFDNLLSFLMDEVFSKEEMKVIIKNMARIIWPNDYEETLDEVTRYDIFDHIEGTDLLLEYFISVLTEEQLDKVLKKLVPGYLTEAVSDLFKGKSKEEIEKNISEIFDLQAIRNKIESFSMGHLLALYIWESDWDTTLFFKDTETIIKNLVDYSLEAYKNDWKRQIVVYRIMENEGGMFTSEGAGPSCNGGVRILLDMWIQENWQDKKVVLNIWD